MRGLVFGTSYCATAERLRLLELWAEALQRIAPDMDHLIVDSRSPAFDTTAYRFLSAFGPRVTCCSETTLAPVGPRSVISFADNIGHLSAGGRDGWGRAFSQGLLSAMNGGYDYVVHVEGDLLTRLDLPAICRLMRDHRIDALGTVSPGFGWPETGLLFFRVDFLRQSRLVESYDWRRRLPVIFPEVILSELLGGKLFLQLWRGAKGDAAMLNYTITDLHWLTKAENSAAYDAFMAGGDWPAPEYGGPVGLDDSPRTTTWYRHVAGTPNNQHNLGLRYAAGQLVPQDFAAAAALFLDAASRGYAPSQTSLGFQYHNGQGVPQDFSEAMRWYAKAASQGDARAENNIGVMHAEGQGVPRDYTEAARWYRRAAERGFAQAQHNLGFLHERGGEDVTAARWYQLAARQGLADAQISLGILYYMGRGVPQDDLQAYRWFSLAASQGRPDAAANRNIVAARMTAAQIQAAEALIAARKPDAGKP